MKEAAFLKMVLALAKLHGWRTMHVRPARSAKGWRTPVQGDGIGFPDLILIKGCRILAVELKGKKGKVTEDQQAWLDAFLGAGVSVRVWRPGDWKEIEEELSR